MFYLQNSNNGLGNIIYQLLNIIYQATIEKKKINLQELKNIGKYENRKYYLNKIFNIDEIQNHYITFINQINRKDTTSNTSLTFNENIPDRNNYSTIFNIYKQKITK